MDLLTLPRAAVQYLVNQPLTDIVTAGSLSTYTSSQDVPDPLLAAGPQNTGFHDRQASPATDGRIPK
ncbi:hypothetical protein GCM10010977_29550 [Citricoccus zhacaiensis]|uniref:Uncharacterized protein n=2 Tax=Citricoccus TaxID=169133 RepID=A0ABV6F1A9_9MICC|nr:MULTISPECIES: hypothetical protein [Citricoccus]GGO48894.1 hypothetical protein GCM10010977_29550 [Citricoccus zhacaiensis]VXC14745.1 conserved hypothetical protein [Citricoccus sp. K5]